MLRRPSLFLGALAVAITLESAALARPARVNQIPNGDVFRCLTCHEQSNGGTRNAFGLQVEQTLIGSGSTATVDWPAVAPLDADGDGLTNGEELADPDGDGTPGGGSVSNPGDANDPGEADPDPMDTLDTGDDEPASGCDHTGGTPLGAVAGAAALLLLRRRHAI